MKPIFVNGKLFKVKRITDKPEVPTLEEIIIGAGANQIVELKGERLNKYASKRFIRSANLIDLKGRTYLALGFVHEGDSAIELRSINSLSKTEKLFTLKGYDISKDPTKGIGSIIAINDVIYASHSGEGLFRFNLNHENGEKIYHAKNVRFLNKILIHGKIHFTFSGDGISVLPYDFSKDVRCIRYSKDIKVTCSTVFEDCVYIGTKDKKLMSIDLSTEKPALIELFSLEEKPYTIHVEKFNGDRHLFASYPRRNLIAINLDLDEQNVFFLRYQDPEKELEETVETILYHGGRLYAAAGKKLLRFDLTSRSLVGNYDAGQRILSIVKYINFRGV